MRGPYTGALSRTYLHSGITESLWYAVTEIESMFGARLSHAVMLASLYGNPAAKLDAGNDQIHDMYLAALGTIPYIKTSTSNKSSDVAELVEAWKRMNAEAPEGNTESPEEGEQRDV